MKKLFLLIPLILVWSFLISSCASNEVSSTGLKIISENEYHKTVDNWTSQSEKYSGLYNIINMTATLLNTEMQSAALDQNARLYQWDEAKYLAEKGKVEDSMRNQTEFFVSFFTPEKKTDTLSRSGSQWKIFLDSEGRRFEGKAVKVKLETVEIQSFYHYHTRFATPYRMTFPVPIKTIEGKPMKLTVTSPSGSASLDYPALIKTN